MLRKISREYLDDVVCITKGYVESKRANCSATVDENSGDISLTLPWGIEVSTCAVLDDDGSPQKDEFGNLVLDYNHFDVHGSTLHFIAFCLQEGELKPSLDLLDAEDWRYEKYYGDVPDLYGNYTTLPHELARSIFKDTLGVQYCISTKD